MNYALEVLRGSQVIKALMDHLVDNHTYFKPSGFSKVLRNSTDISCEIISLMHCFKMGHSDQRLTEIYVGYDSEGRLIYLMWINGKNNVSKDTAFLYNASIHWIKLQFHSYNLNMCKWVDSCMKEIIQSFDKERD